MMVPLASLNSSVLFLHSPFQYQFINAFNATHIHVQDDKRSIMQQLPINSHQTSKRHILL
jgi:hypothetical protein